MENNGLSKEDFLNKLNAELKYRMLRHCMNNSFTRQDAEDIFQNMLAKLWLSETIDTSDYIRSVQFAWLTFKRLMIDGVRKDSINSLGKYKKTELETDTELAHVYNTITPDDVYMNVEIGEAIERAVSSLSNKKQYVARMRMKDESYENIIDSETYQLSTTSAKSIWRRARLVMMEELKDYENYYT